jgi:hypothetical protein
MSGDVSLHVERASFADRLAALFAACRKHSRVRDYYLGVDLCDACHALANDCEVLVAVEALEPDPNASA